MPVARADGEDIIIDQIINSLSAVDPTAALDMRAGSPASTPHCRVRGTLTRRALDAALNGAFDPSSVDAALGGASALDPSSVDAALGGVSAFDPSSVDAALGGASALDPSSVDAALGGASALDPSSVDSALSAASTSARLRRPTRRPPTRLPACTRRTSTTRRTPGTKSGLPAPPSWATSLFSGITR